MIPEAREPKFPIGTTYRTRGKFPRQCTVTEILRTYDSKGTLVRVRYVAAHVGATGQTIVDSDVCETTVAMGVGL